MDILHNFDVEILRHHCDINISGRWIFELSVDYSKPLLYMVVHCHQDMERYKYVPLNGGIPLQRSSNKEWYVWQGCSDHDLQYTKRSFDKNFKALQKEWGYSHVPEPSLTLLAPLTVYADCQGC